MRMGNRVTTHRAIVWRSMATQAVNQWSIKRHNFSTGTKPIQPSWRSDWGDENRIWMMTRNHTFTLKRVIVKGEMIAKARDTCLSPSVSPFDYGMSSEKGYCSTLKPQKDHCHFQRHWLWAKLYRMPQLVVQHIIEYQTDATRIELTSITIKTIWTNTKLPAFGHHFHIRNRLHSRAAVRMSSSWHAAQR